MPIGAGLAFAHKYNGTGGVAWAFYGDGAASQGQIHEAFNMSKLWNLPVVYVCENNQYAMGTVANRHSANTEFYTRGDLIPGVKVSGGETAAPSTLLISRSCLAVFLGRRNESAGCLGGREIC